MLETVAWEGEELYNFATYATIHFDEVLYDRYSSRMPYGFVKTPPIFCSSVKYSVLVIPSLYIYIAILRYKCFCKDTIEHFFEALQLIALWFIELAFSNASTFSVRILLPHHLKVNHLSVWIKSGCFF
jgi:hypothetical protein